MSAPIAGPLPTTFASRQGLFTGTGSGTNTSFYPGTDDIQTSTAGSSALATVNLCLIESVLVGICGADTDLVFLEHDGSTVLWSHFIDASAIDTPRTIKFGRRGILLNEGFSIQLLAAGTSNNTNATSLYLHYRTIHL